jgi:hypothetical protein
MRLEEDGKQTHDNGGTTGGEDERPPYLAEIEYHRILTRTEEEKRLPPKRVPRKATKPSGKEQFEGLSAP